jgi:heme/copper-type cytochrome/quinol oxidase subunit 2
MPIVVDVRTPDDFKKWVEEQKAALNPAAVPAAAPAPSAAPEPPKTARLN